MCAAAETLLPEALFPAGNLARDAPSASQLSSTYVLLQEAALLATQILSLNGALFLSAGGLISAPVVRQRRKLVLLFRGEQDHPFETHPSELRRLQWLAEEQQDSEQEQLQDSEQEQQDSDQEQLSEEEQLDAKQKKSSKKWCRSKEWNLSPQRATSSLEVLPDVTHDQSLFSINPNFGTIAPGQKKTFHVLFSPKDVGNFETTMLCRWETWTHLPTHTSDGYH